MDRGTTGNLIRLFAVARSHLPQSGKAYGVFRVGGANQSIAYIDTRLCGAQQKAGSSP